MSLSGRITEEIGCEPTPRGNDPIHTYICRSVAAGVTYVAAAGNDSLDTDLEIPATYEQVIAVSAIADFDGRPGGLAGTQPICTPDEPGERDDTFAFFSNFGQDIDISAPGVCIDSIRPGGTYSAEDGTSFSAPYVAGAAALFKAKNPSASPPRSARR